MPGTARIAALLLMFGVSTGHAAMRPLADASPAAIQQQVKPGDEVRVVVRGGRSYDLKVTRVESETLTGAADSGKHYRIRYSAIERIEVEDVVTVTDETAAPPELPEGAAKTWLGLSTGFAIGGVDLPCTGAAVSSCSETGMFSTYGLSLTFAGEMALRLRAVRANEHDEHKPVETAVLVGPRLSKSLYFLLGVGSIHNPDDEYAGDSTTGLAWEFLIADPTPSGVSFEASLHGNHLGDAQYGGLSIGVRFGKMR